MFLDLLDTIKTSEKHHTLVDCEINAMIGESMMYYLILAGQTPTLTQTQVMDSNIIHNILRDKNRRIYFLEMLQSGYIKVALYTGNGSRSLQDYFKKSLTYGMDDDTEFFDFSIMPFLGEYDSKVRKNLNKKILSAIEHNSYNFNSDGVKPEHTDYIGCIVDNIQDIDKAVRGKYLLSNTYRKNIDDLFRAQCEGIINDKNTNSEFLELCQRMMNKNSYKNRRSIYYNYIENMRSNYSNESIDKMRQVIDNCYNEAIASLINDDGYSLNFSSKYVDLMKLMDKNENVVKKEVIGIKRSNAEKYFTWAILSDIMKEVEELKNKKNLSQTEALIEYKKRQSYKPIVSVAKYLGVTAITSFIPGIPHVVEIFSDIISGTVSDVAGEKMRKPSLGEIVGDIRNTKNNTRIAENAIEFISMSMK